jgi:hypothetical protein
VNAVSKSAERGGDSDYGRFTKTRDQQRRW